MAHCNAKREARWWLDGNGSWHQWRYGDGAAVAEVVFVHHVVELELKGLVTRSTLAQVLADVERESVRRVRLGRVHAYVVDVSGCAIALDTDELAELELNQNQRNIIAAPIVFVVSDEQIELFQRHADAMDGHGLLRVPAATLAGARTWAHRRAMFAEWDA